MSRRPVPSLLLLALCAAVSACSPSAPCPDHLNDTRQVAEGASLTCTCAAERTESGSVWGSERYTADSRVCRAARHAGVIGAEGGKVTVWAFGECSEFAATSRNGVESSSWGSYGRSFAFTRNQGCVGEVPAGAPPRCPASATGLDPSAAEGGLACSCTPSMMRGTVWGTDLYTADSSICTAARHAGAVGADGGAVTVFPAGRCESYEASERNGVTSGGWGAYDASFAFRSPLPTCPDGSAPEG